MNQLRMVTPHWVMTMPYELLTPDEVLLKYGISPSVLDRMVREGLIAYIRADGEQHVRSDCIERIVLASANMPTLLTCSCAGPCDCEIT